MKESLQQVVRRCLKGNKHHLQMKLYSFPMSTCSWRVRAAIYHHFNTLAKLMNDSEQPTSQQFASFMQNNVIGIDLLSKQNESQTYLGVNAMQQVPSLVLKEVTAGGDGTEFEMVLTQSLPIIEFLDNLTEIISMELEGPSSDLQNRLLIPKDAILAYRTRQLSEIVNSGIQPFQNIKLLRMIPPEVRGEQNKKWVGVWQRKGLNQIETLLKDQYSQQDISTNSKPLYAIRDRLTMADLCLIPNVDAAVNRTDINVRMEYPFTMAIYDSLKELDLFHLTSPSQKYSQ